MKKNIVKFIIIFLLIFGISDSKVFAQFSKKISGEQLEKLLTENYILINGRFGSFKWEFNKDKTYYVFPHHDKTFQMPNNGTWEITGFLGGGSSLILTDRQQIINGRNIKYQFYFGEDGYIYTGSERMHTYSLENIQEKISREARLVEEKRIAEELRLKKIEEEKRQLAIKREQERIKAEQIKKEEEKKRLELAEWAKKEEEAKIKRDNEERIKLEREEFYKNILKYSLISIFLSALSFFIYKYRTRIKNEFYPKFIKYVKNLKLNSKEFYPKFIKYVEDIKTNSDKKLGITIIGVFFVVIVLLVIFLGGNRSSTSNQNYSGYSSNNEVSDEKFKRYVELRTAIKRECDNKWYTRGLSTIAADVERTCRNNMYDVHSKTFIGESSEVKRKLREYGVYE
jgi:hypothetical protein